jgi:hypothetical protein
MDSKWNIQPWQYILLSKGNPEVSSSMIHDVLQEK